MSHGDAVHRGAGGLHRRSRRTGGRRGRRVRGPRPPAAGVQFHPEVLHTEHGQAVLEHFLYDIAGCRPTWTMANVVEEQVDRDPRAGRRQAGDLRAVRRRRLGGRRGAGAAGDRRPAHLRLRRPRPAARGRGRAGRARLRRRDRRRRSIVVDAAERFLDALAGVTDPEEKRKIIGREFIRVFEAGRPRGRRRRRRPRRDRRLPRAGHALPRRRRVRRRHRHGEHQEPPQRRRPARRPAVRARRAAAHAVQGRGAPGRPRARPARGDRVAPAVPRPGPRHPDRRRGHRGAARRRCARPTRSPARS